LIWLCATLLILLQGRQAFPQNKTGKVSVTINQNSLFEKVESEAVKDETVRPEPMFQIFLRRNKFYQRLVKTKPGTYELDVPGGFFYEIQLAAENGIPLNYGRANFYVAPNHTRHLRLRLLEDSEVCDKEIGLSFVPDDSGGRNDLRAPQYDRYFVHRSSYMVIKHCGKSRGKRGTVYKFALLTYKNMTLYADKIRFDKERLRIEASGNVEFDVVEGENDCTGKGTRVILGLGKLKERDLPCNALKL
jgi:hypothetical protein